MRAMVFGEAMVGLVPTGADPLEKNESYVATLAGAEANVGVHLAALGFSVSFVGRVGDDPFGRRIVSELVRAGVSVDLVEVVPGEQTGVYFRERGTEAPRVVYYRAGSAASRLRPTSQYLAALAGTELLHYTGITPQLSESCFQTTIALARRARELGVTTSFDLNFRPALGSWEQFAEIGRAVGLSADIVFLSPREVLSLAGVADDRLEASDRLLRDHPDVQEIVVRDRRSAAAVGRNGSAEVPAIQGIEAIDVAGAGDAFAAGYLAARTWGYAFPDRLWAGHLLGAEACRVLGDSRGTIGAAALRGYLDGHG